MRGLNKTPELFSRLTKRRRKFDMSLTRGQHFLRGLSHSGNALETPETNNHLFCYKSGRWLYDEQLQLRRRYIKFNVQSLQETASRVLGTQCVEITKLPEGLYNKVFSLKMEDGREILARIPNPNAGHPHCVVASEVATLDFLRNVLDIPVPEILSWSSPSSQPSSVGADYILMERVKGRQLSEVWATMSEAQRFGLVKSLVEIEKRLVSTKLAGYGSLYYKDTYPDGLSVVDPTELPGLKLEVISKFVIGPTTERSFCVDKSQDQGVDRGPWRTIEEYISAVASREMSLIRNFKTDKCRDASLLLRGMRAAPDKHIQLLEQFVAILPHILPATEIAQPTLLHHDLHSDNIFVDDTDPTKISSIIDWQAVYSAPLFLQARFPSIFDSDDAYPWGAVQPEPPDDFDTLSQSEKELAREALVRLRLKKFYELASRKFNPMLVRAMDAMRNDNDPTAFIFHIIGHSAIDGPIPLKELLIQIYEKWDQITERRGLTIPCPISFTEEEIKEGREQAQEWADAYSEFEGLRTQIAGKDGWVSHDEYEEAMRRFESHKERLETLRQRLEPLS